MYSKKNYVLIIFSFALFFLIGWKLSEYYNYSLIQEAKTDGTTRVVTENIIKDVKDIDMSLYIDVYDEIKLNYVDEFATQDEAALLYGSIKGLVNSLGDPYTVFMTPDETEQFEQSLNGSLQGIGAELTVEEGFLIVVSPLKNSPAEKAGLQPKDIIFLIDGETANEMTLFDAIMNIRGEKGTDVTLTIIREEVDEPFDVVITRDEIDLESVTFEMLEGDIAYVSINQFSDNTPEEFDEVVNKLLLNEPAGLVLDVRYNGGGYLDIAVDIVSEFVDGKQPVVTIKTKTEENDETFYLDDKARLPNIPMVVLVNEGSASASEILAGAIQDHKRGIVMGTQTFGKGSVQEVEMLSDGSSLRLTIAKWLTPSGRDIEEVGIMPDTIVEWPDEDYDAGVDTQLEAARTYLLNM